MRYTDDLVGTVPYTDPPAAVDAGNGSTGVRGTVHPMSLVWSTPEKYADKRKYSDGVGTDGASPPSQKAVGRKHVLSDTTPRTAGGISNSQALRLQRQT